MKRILPTRLKNNLHSHGARTILILAPCIIALAVIASLLLSHPSPEETDTEGPTVFEVSDYAAAYPEDEKESLMEEKDPDQLDIRENDGSLDEVHGWPSGSALICATGIVRSINQSAGSFVFSDFEDEVASEVGTSSLEFQRPDHPSGGMGFEELHEGMQVTVSFLWPRTTSLTGVITTPEK